jgi:hypothetical protein
MYHHTVRRRISNPVEYIFFPSRMQTPYIIDVIHIQMSIQQSNMYIVLYSVWVCQSLHPKFTPSLHTLVFVSHVERCRRRLFYDSIQFFFFSFLFSFPFFTPTILYIHTYFSFAFMLASAAALASSCHNGRTPDVL